MNLFNIFKKKKYLDCPYLKHSIHFFYNEIRACGSNSRGPVFYEDFTQEETIDWDKIYKIRKKYIDKINSPFNFNRYAIPKECKGCFRIPEYLSSRKVEYFDNYVKYILIQNYMSCNAKCIYCIYGWTGNGSKYNVYNIIESLLKTDLIDDRTEVVLSGGEITIAPYFEDLMKLLTSKLETQISISTSGIKYSKEIESAFKKNKCLLIIALDSGSKKTYEKIKKVDCFEKVINNIKKYIQESDFAKNFIVLKYIIIDDINDNIEELEKFIEIAANLGIENVQLTVDYQKYSCSNKKKVPEHYFKLVEKFKELTKNKDINGKVKDQAQNILNK